MSTPTVGRTRVVHTRTVQKLPSPTSPVAVRQVCQQRRSQKPGYTVTKRCLEALVNKQKFSTFTNKEGRVLTQHSKDVWGAERPFAWLGIDVNGRGAVVKLSDGSLWVHSPVKLDPELKAAMDALGPVKHIVTPNFEHNNWHTDRCCTLFAAVCNPRHVQWIEAYPDAKSYVCPGGKKKYPDIEYSQEIGQGNKAPSEWLGEIEPTFLSYEAVPVLKFPFFNEVVFVHKSSGTLIATDLIWNYPGSGTPKGTQAWKFGMDRVYRPFYNNLMIKDKGAFQIATRRLVEELQWDAILPCHGNYIPSGGKLTLQKHLRLKH